MTFRVEPAALRDYARQLGEVERVAEEADRYIATHGSFSLQEGGIIGLMTQDHPQVVAGLHELLAHLKRLGIESRASLLAAASSYESTDAKSAAEIDAGYPAAPGGIEFRD